MVTKGIITEIINKYQARVRIPIYNKAEDSPTATPNEELSIGPVNTLPGINPNISVGDVVIIAFEHDIYTDPVILGLLYTENSSRGFSDVKAGELSVVSEATLPFKTTIGNVTGDQIFSLKDVKGNVQNQLDLLSDKLSEITESSVYDVKVAGTSVVTDGIANIPYASTSQAGVVSTEAQTFAGNKTFIDDVRTSGFFRSVNDGEAQAGILFANNTNTPDYGVALYAEKSKLNGVYHVTRPIFAINSYSSSTGEELLENELFRFPTVEADLTSNKGYNIITTKNLTDIPDADASTRGLVSTEAQTFAGEKTFTSSPTVSVAGSDANVKVSISSGSASVEYHAYKNNYGGRAYINETSGKSDGTGNTGHYERYFLPQPAVDRTSNDDYDILTSKHAVTVAQGGTGATDAATARSNLGIGASGTHADSYFALASHTHLYAGSSSPGGAATNVNVTTKSTGNQHYLLCSTGNSGSQATCASADAYLYLASGAVSLNIGGSSTQGRVTFRSNTTNIINLIGATATANRTITLPNATGTVSLEGHTHSYAGSSSAGGPATSAIKVQAWEGTTSSNRLTTADQDPGNGYLMWFHATSSMTTSKPYADGHIIHCAWDNSSPSWSTQLFLSNGKDTCGAAIRGRNASAWGEWQPIIVGTHINNSSYWGLSVNGSESGYLRMPTTGIIPYTNGGAGSGHSYIGTSSWYFSHAYIDNIYTTSGAAGFKCRNISYGSGNPSGGSSGDIYIKFV